MGQEQDVPGDGPVVPVPAELPEEAYAAALASVPGVGPARLRRLCADASPRAAWRSLCDGGADGEPWMRAASREAGCRDVAAIWRAHRDANVRVCVRGAQGYPRVLEHDPEAPAVLFALGDTAPLDTRARVAIVGTRSATRYGLGVAAQLGTDLAAAGVVVVSGLALGIDGASHEGAVAAWRAAQSGAPCAVGPRHEGDGGTTTGEETATFPGAAPPVAVVAGSLSAPYPPQHKGLWQRVGASGAIVSEAPIGAADLGWRFPMRNRIIAALADVVVVVECHARGGALHTVQAAAARGTPVGAVPGSVRSPASAGTNALLADGCFVVRDAADVLVALGLATASAAPVHAGSRRDGGVAAHAPDDDGAVEVPPDEGTAAVLDALGWEPCALDEVVRHTGRALDEVAVILEHCRRLGIVDGTGGVWRRV